MIKEKKLLIYFEKIENYFIKYFSNKDKENAEIEEHKTMLDQRAKFVDEQGIQQLLDVSINRSNRGILGKFMKYMGGIPDNEIPWLDILLKQEIKNKYVDLDKAYILNLALAKAHRVEDRILKLITFLIDYANDKDIQKFEERRKELYKNCET